MLRTSDLDTPSISAPMLPGARRAERSAHGGGTPAQNALGVVDPPAQWQRGYGRLLRVSDSVVIVGVVAIAHIVRFGHISSGTLAGSVPMSYWLVSAGIVLAWIGALAAYRTRSPEVVGSGVEEYRRVLTASLAVFGLIAIASTVLRIDFARGYLAIAFPLGLIALTLNRWCGRRYIAWQRRQGRYLNAVLAVGDSGSADRLAQTLARRQADGYSVVGVCATDSPKRDSMVVPGAGTIPVLPLDAGIEEAVVAVGADTVAVASGHLNPDEIRDLSWRLETLNVDMMVSPGMVDVAGPRLTVRPVNGSPLLHLEKPQYHGAKRFEKRLFDVCFSALVLILMSPVLLPVALSIKATSRGPVFYMSTRIGIDGTPFRMIKFRSMVVDADKRLSEVAALNESDGLLFKIRDDPRVTRIGKFIRRYSIDELPQFINVLRGEMSVVGPRPPLPTEVEGYDDQIRRRLLVRPGITGLWQVSGRSDLDWDESVRLDLSYVENWSMTGDLVIVASTFKAVLAGDGAY